jgi:hypothetical protein
MEIQTLLCQHHLQLKFSCALQVALTDGFDFYWTDKYAENLFARGFEAQSIFHSTAAAFEVLEHIENPLAFLRGPQNTYRFDT